MTCQPTVHDIVLVCGMTQIYQPTWHCVVGWLINLAQQKRQQRGRVLRLQRWLYLWRQTNASGIKIKRALEQGNSSRSHNDKRTELQQTQQQQQQQQQQREQQHQLQRHHHQQQQHCVGMWDDSSTYMILCWYVGKQKWDGNFHQAFFISTLVKLILINSTGVLTHDQRLPRPG